MYNKATHSFKDLQCSNDNLDKKHRNSMVSSRLICICIVTSVFTGKASFRSLRSRLLPMRAHATMNLLK